MSDIIGPDEHAKTNAAHNDGGQRRADGASENRGQGRRKEGKVAAMGLAWAQAINTRLVLQRCGPHTVHYESSHGRGSHPGNNGPACDEWGFESSLQVGLRQVRL